VFIPSDIHTRDLHQIHFQAWKKGVKSMYYLRSKSVQRAEIVAAQSKSMGKIEEAKPVPGQTDYEECLACQ
jgi:ribonucleoside-diphosphate reductase alpha chain